LTEVRTPHAERMDRLYRYQRRIYDATRKHYLLGRDTLIVGLCPPDGGAVLEIGCGTAWNLIRAAELYPSARFFGLDVSTVMLETARRSIARNGLEALITLAAAEAAMFEPVRLFGVARFERVFISYAISMIPAWRDALEQAASRLGPNGSLHIVDFGQCEGLPKIFKSALFAWLDRFAVTPRKDLRTALEVLAARHGLALHFAPIHRGYAYYAVLARR
jgi:S-adenosylmethionine-diacylgycerolhomoserine-N-methlytransferase